jgi:hypothetical protein
MRYPVMELHALHDAVPTWLNQMQISEAYVFIVTDQNHYVEKFVTLKTNRKLFVMLKKVACVGPVPAYTFQMQYNNMNPRGVALSIESGRLVRKQRRGGESLIKTS